MQNTEKFNVSAEVHTQYVPTKARGEVRPSQLPNIELSRVGNKSAKSSGD